MTIQTKFDVGDRAYWLDEESNRVRSGTVDEIRLIIDGPEPSPDSIRYVVGGRTFFEPDLHEGERQAIQATIDRYEGELIKLRGTLK